MTQFQFKQNFGKQCYGFIYFYMHEKSTDLEIQLKAINENIKYYANSFSGWTGKAMEIPTLTITELKDEKKVRNGKVFKTKWI